MPKMDVHVQLIKRELLIAKERKGDFMSEEKPTIREKLGSLKDRFNTWRYSHIKPSKNESNKVTDEDLESALKTDSSEYFAEEKADDGYIYDRAIGYNRKYLGFQHFYLKLFVQILAIAILLILMFYYLSPSRLPLTPINGGA